MATIDQIADNRLVMNADQSPQLFFLVHAEEEFDWSQPFSRAATATTHCQHLPDLHSRITGEGFRAVYLCDYPFAQSEIAARHITDWIADGSADVGAQLHSWVTPPFEEVVSDHNSFQCNLPADLERAKIAALTDLLTARFGSKPSCFLAGRYGYAARTSRIIADAGYRVNFSIDAGRDHSPIGGSDFRAIDARPFWDASVRDLLHIPHSAGYTGWASHSVYSGVSQDTWPGRVLTHMLAPGNMLQRLRGETHIRLSPEGYPLPVLKRLTRALYTAGQRVFTYSLHSPTITPGHTPYTPDRASTDAFMADISEFLRFFRDDLGGVAVDPHDFYAQHRDARP